MTRVQEIYPDGRVTLREVGLRDGLQLVKKFPSTAAKTTIAASGLAFPGMARAS